MTALHTFFLGEAVVARPLCVLVAGLVLALAPGLTRAQLTSSTSPVSNTQAATPAGKTTGAQGPLAALAPPPAGPNPYAHARITTRLIAGANHTHGYEVLVDGRILVSQPSIPGRAGNAGFRTPAEAQRVAALVARKVRANQMPPTVSEAELRRLRAGQ